MSYFVSFLPCFTQPQGLWCNRSWERVEQDVPWSNLVYISAGSTTKGNFWAIVFCKRWGSTQMRTHLCPSGIYRWLALQKVHVVSESLRRLRITLKTACCRSLTPSAATMTSAHLCEFCAILLQFILMTFTSAFHIVAAYTMHVQWIRPVRHAWKTLGWARRSIVLASIFKPTSLISCQKFPCFWV